MGSMIVDRGCRIDSVQVQRMFVVDVFRTDGAQFVPEVQNRRDDNGDANADDKENPISGQEDKQRNDGADGDD